MYNPTTTCAKIKNSVLTLAKSKQLAKIKVKDVIEHAQIPKSSFYYNFHSLDEVVEEMIDDILVELYNNTYRGSKVPNYIDGAVSINITLFIEQHIEFMSLLIYSHHQINFIKKLEHVFQKLILNRFHREQLKPSDQLHITAQMLAYGFVGSWAQTLCDPNPSTIAKLVYTLEHIMINYIHTERNTSALK